MPLLEIKRGSQSNIYGANDILELNQLAVATDVRNNANGGSGVARLGDGVTRFDDLPNWPPITPPTQTLTDAATISWVFEGNSSQNAKVTLTDNRTLSITGMTNGATGTLIVIQDAVGSRTLTLPAGSKVANGGSGAVTLTPTASARDILSFYYDGTSFYWNVGLNYT